MTLPELSRKIDATGGRGTNATYRYIFTAALLRPYAAFPSACSRFLSGSPFDPWKIVRRRDHRRPVPGHLPVHRRCENGGEILRPGMVALLWAPNALGSPSPRGSSGGRSTM